jgi:hypothetical protein
MPPAYRIPQTSSTINRILGVSATSSRLLMWALTAWQYAHDCYLPSSQRESLKGRCALLDAARSPAVARTYPLRFTQIYNMAVVGAADLLSGIALIGE